MSYYLPSGDYVMEMKQTNDELWWESAMERLTDDELEDLRREIEERKVAKTNDMLKKGEKKDG